jgi:hypothetical protein
MFVYGCVTASHFDVTYFSTTLNFEKNRGYFCYLLRLFCVSCMYMPIFNFKTNSNGT